MVRAVVRPAVAADAGAVTELVVALESSLYGESSFSQADLEGEWSELDLAHNTRVASNGERIVGYGAIQELGRIAYAEAYVHPDAFKRGVGTMLASGLEEDAARLGAHAIRNSVLEADSAGRGLLESRGYVAVRIYREVRITLDAPPPIPDWPDGLRVVPFDPAHDARDFHAAHQEAFAEHWGHTPKDFETWSKSHLASERFDPTLWCVVRSDEEIAGGTICAGATYGGGFVHALFTRPPWRKQGVGAALLNDAFGRFWQRGERSVGLGVDAANETGAFRLYERAGMTPKLGWVVFEKALGEAS
jgi:mycothiol synthase